jgi:hypothetical protein
MKRTYKLFKEHRLFAIRDCPNRLIIWPDKRHLIFLWLAIKVYLKIQELSEITQMESLKNQLKTLTKGGTHEKGKKIHLENGYYRRIGILCLNYDEPGSLCEGHGAVPDR